MSKYLVVSGRNHFERIADLLSFELEDTLVDCLDADIYCIEKNPKLGKYSNINYEVIFIAVNNFKQLAETVKLMRKAEITGQLKCAYVFGGYACTIEGYFNTLRQTLSKTYKAFRQIDHVFTGIEEDVTLLNEGLNIPVHYCPMAVNVLKIDAHIKDRPISINGFGRQEPNISNLLADTFNQPDSQYFYYHTNFLNISTANDWVRYRDMFWHVLRQSKLSLAFDSLYYNPYGHARHSFVGPRWYESLGAGNIVVGVAPKSPNAAVLLDWKNATIELPKEPDEAIEKIISILENPEFMDKVIRRNLLEMNKRHDWRHRIKNMLDKAGITIPTKLNSQLELLQQKSDSFKLKTPIYRDSWRCISSHTTSNCEGF